MRTVKSTKTSKLARNAKICIIVLLKVNVLKIQKRQSNFALSTIHQLTAPSANNYIICKTGQIARELKISQIASSTLKPTAPRIASNANLSITPTEPTAEREASLILKIAKPTIKPKITVVSAKLGS